MASLQDECTIKRIDDVTSMVPFTCLSSQVYNIETERWGAFVYKLGYRPRTN